MDRYNESREIGIFRWKRKRIIINVYKLYLHVFLRRRTNLNRKNDYVSSTTENALLPVQEQRWNWLKPTTTIEASSYTNREREKKGERERVHNGASPRPGRWKGRGKKRRKKREKENQFPRSGQLGGIHRDTTFPWPRKSGISKERRICVQKTDGFHPVATLLSIQPPPSPPRFFFSTLNRFFYATSPLFSLFFFFSLPFFEFNRRLTPWNFRRNPSEYAGYASSASPPLISSLRCEMISRNQEKIYLPLPPSFCVSLPLSLFRAV